MRTSPWSCSPATTTSCARGNSAWASSCVSPPTRTRSSARSSAAAGVPTRRAAPGALRAHRRGRGEAHVLVDQEIDEGQVAGTLARDASARAQIVDEAIDDVVDAQIIGARLPRAPLRLVAEAVRLPRHGKAQIAPAVARDDRALRNLDAPGVAAREAQTHAGLQAIDGLRRLLHAIDAVKDRVGVEENGGIEADRLPHGWRVGPVRIERELAAHR